MLKEEYFGCSCFDLDHISHFSKFDDENFIFFAVKIGLWRNGFIPYVFCIKDYFSKEYWKTYFNTSFFSRFFVVYNYLFKNKVIGNYFFDAMQFKEEDYTRLIILLNNIKNNIKCDVEEQSILFLKDEKEEFCVLFFLEENCLKFEISFYNKTILGKIKSCLKYIFNYKIKDRVYFKMSEDNINILRNMILNTKEI